jgi:hypothetical protein
MAAHWLHRVVVGSAAIDRYHSLQEERCSVVLVHCFRFGTTSLLVLDPLDKVVNNGWPRRLLGPESQGLVRESELGELECLVPHVLVNALLEGSGEELLPPVQPRRAGTRPLDRRKRRAEEKIPEGYGLIESRLLGIAGSGYRERILVDTLEKFPVPRQLCLQVPDIGLLLLDGIAAV